MKMASFLAAGMMFSSLAAATPAVTSVTAQQRYPWNGNVDVVVTFSGASNDVAQLECVFLATNSATRAALPVVHVTPEKDIAGSGTTWTRRFVWDATADVGEDKIADTLVAFATGENGLTSLAGATETKTVTIPAAQATSGLYYSLLVSSDLGFTAPTETPHVLADGANDLHFDIDPAEDPSAPRFFKVKASFK